MRALLVGFALVCVALALSSGKNLAQDKEKKEVVLKGTITCAKCDLGVEKACTTVIVVKEDKKDITYYFDKAAHKKHHGETCTEPKKGSVEGTVKDVDKKKVVTVKKLTYE